MKLSNSAIKDIQGIKDSYEKMEKIADTEFMVEILNVLKNESKFYWKLKYNFIDSKTEPTAFMKNEQVYFNYEKLLKHCEYLASTWKSNIKLDDMKPMINLYFIYSIFHECAHLYQVTGLSDDSEVNRYYKDLYNRFSKLSLKLWYIYYKNPVNVSFERHANVDAFRELSKIYKGSIISDVAEASHMVSLNYLKNLESPVVKTIKDARLKNNYDFERLSIEDALELGAPLTREILVDFDNIIIKYSREEISYDEAQDQIRLIKER